MKVSVRGGFSDRMGIKPQNTEIQLKKFDERTRIQIYNCLNKLCNKMYGNINPYNNKRIQEFFRYILSEIYSQSVDFDSQYNANRVFNIIEETVLNDSYDDVLTLTEAILNYWVKNVEEKKVNDDIFNSFVNGEDFVYDGIKGSEFIFDTINELFKREYVGYRYIDGRITPISDEYEVETIKETLENPYSAVREHISKANVLLSDRKNPDYENSIKESILAVETLCRVILGVKGQEATLGKMLKKLEDNGVTIHGSMKSAFNQLYGYTSDANGIRHAGDIGGPSSTFEEAKFMMISCCAFINYLIALSK